MENFSEKVVLLHGDLDLNIHEARHLPNMDMFSEYLRRCISTCRSSLPETDHPHHTHPHHHPHPHQPHHRKIITSDPYVSVCLVGDTIARTRVITNSENPVWNEHFALPLAHYTPSIEFQVKDNDIFGSQLIGTVTVPAHLIASGKLISDWFPVIGPSGNQPKPDTALRMSMQFKPVGENPLYRNGIAGDPERLGIRGTYFPVRKGGKVTLYQDAHVREGELPAIELENGRVFRHERCWEDICEAILEAQHLIYIVGWSIYDKVRLVREPTRKLPKAGDLTLGDLLKYKTQEGVRVCLLVWDDKTSHHLLRKTVARLHTKNTMNLSSGEVILAKPERFDGKNYKRWHNQMKYWLNLLGLLSTLDGTSSSADAGSS